MTNAEERLSSAAKPSLFSRANRGIQLALWPGMPGTPHPISCQPDANVAACSLIET